VLALTFLGIFRNGRSKQLAVLWRYRTTIRRQVYEKQWLHWINGTHSN